MSFEVEIPDQELGQRNTSLLDELDTFLNKVEHHEVTQHRTLKEVGELALLSEVFSD